MTLLFAPLLFLAPTPAPPQTGSAPDRRLTAEDLVARCARAMGGADKIERVTTIKTLSVYPDHGSQPIPNEIRRPNQSYSPNSGIAFDGKRACWQRGKDGKSAPEMVGAEELVDFDVEIACQFPAFFDYPAEYLGAEALDGRATHKLQVKLPHGAAILYYLDASSWLPVKAVSRFTLGGKAFVNERLYGDYREVDGILYPHEFTYPARDGGSLKGWITSVEINTPLDAAHFVVPDSLETATKK